MSACWDLSCAFSVVCIAMEGIALRFSFAFEVINSCFGCCCIIDMRSRLMAAVLFRLLH